MKAVFSSVAAASASQGLLGDNPGRGSAIFENKSQGPATVSLAATATAANSSFTIQPNDKYSINGYTGSVTCLFGNSPDGNLTGTMSVTEITT